MTGTCYSEFVQSIPTKKFLQALDPTVPADVSDIKAVLLQLLEAAAIMNKHGILHKDLLLKNTLVRLLPGQTPAFQAVIMDFCWSWSSADPSTQVCVKAPHQSNGYFWSGKLHILNRKASKRVRG